MRRIRRGDSDADHNVRTISSIPANVVASLLIDHFKSLNLQRQGTVAPNAPDLHLTSNIEFWQHFLVRQRPTIRWVELSGFQLIDWFPRAPGLYHTSHARMSRENARRFLTQDQAGEFFYEPSGKVHMIEGGIGSVRFKPIQVEGDYCWMYTATSNNLCHSGIPIVIPDRVLARTNITSFGRFTITGLVRFLPEFLERHFHHLENIPQIYVLVEKIEFIEDTREPVFITPVVFFTSDSQEVDRPMDEYYYRDSGGRNKVTYVTCNVNESGIIDEATAWLEKYVQRYNGLIATNFDQQRPVFRNAPFSLQNVMRGQVNIDYLQTLGIYGTDVIIRMVQQASMEVANVTNNNVNVGDNNTFQGDFVVASSITNSFNKVASSNTPDELKELLKNLTVAVGEMSKQLPPDKQKEVAQDLDTLTTEAVKEQPRRKWWEITTDGLAAAAKNIGAVGVPVLEILTKLTPLIEKVAV